MLEEPKREISSQRLGPVASAFWIVGAIVLVGWLAYMDLSHEPIGGLAPPSSSVTPPLR